MALEGPLQEFSINDIISLISLGKKTGATDISGPLNGKNVEGRLFFRGGNICHAVLMDLPALEAALTFFIFEEGFFRFIDGATPDREDLRMSNEMVIMQGINRSDQWKEIKNLVQPNDIPVMIDAPPTGNIQLRPEDWKLLTMISGQDDVSALAYKTGLGEFRTMQVIATLLTAGLVEKKTRNLKYLLYAELTQLATGQLGQPGKTILDQSYERLGVRLEDDVTFEQSTDLVKSFGKLAALLVGPGRSQRLADEMQSHVRELFQR